MFQISKTFEFSASHALTQLPPTHQCHRLHGHNYKVTVTLQAAHLDSTGFVKDYGDLGPFKEWIQDYWDHRHLNEVMKTVPPTAENIARMMYDWASVMLNGANVKVVKITVQETEKTTATYFAGGS